MKLTPLAAAIQGQALKRRVPCDKFHLIYRTLLEKGMVMQIHHRKRFAALYNLRDRLNR